MKKHIRKKIIGLSLFLLLIPSVSYAQFTTIYKIAGKCVEVVAENVGPFVDEVVRMCNKISHTGVPVVRIARTSIEDQLIKIGLEQIAKSVVKAIDFNLLRKSTNFRFPYETKYALDLIGNDLVSISIKFPSASEAVAFLGKQRTNLIEVVETELKMTDAVVNRIDDNVVKVIAQVNQNTIAKLEYLVLNL